MIVTGASAPLLSPTFTELGNRLRDKLFGKNQKPQENNADISKIIQKWFENPCERNTELLTELTEWLKDLNRNLKDLNQTVPQLTDVLQKTVENTNTCCKRWYSEPRIRNVRINNQETFAYFIENDEFQRKISNGEYRDFMQEGASIVARIRISKRGKQTERSVTNVFEMKCNEETLSLEPKPSDFPLLRQETEEENLKADLERHQLKLFS